MRSSLSRHPFLMFTTDPGDGGGSGTGGAPPADAGDAGDGDKFTDPDTGETYAFPAKTAVKDMQPEQAVEYWRHKARKHETRASAVSDYDQQKADAEKWRQAQREQMPADQRAIEDAVREAREAALVEARTQTAAQLVTAELRAALASRLPADKIAGQVEYLDHTKFLTPTGEVDTDKVTNYASGITATGGTWPDMGQGNRGDASKTSGVSAGKDLFADRHKK